MTKRIDALEVRNAIARLSFGNPQDRHVRDGLLLAVIVHHYLPLDLWTRRELQAALRRAGLGRQAEELEPQGQPRVLEQVIEDAPEPTLGWIDWIRTRWTR